MATRKQLLKYLKLGIVGLHHAAADFFQSLATYLQADPIRSDPDRRLLVRTPFLDLSLRPVVARIDLISDYWLRTSSSNLARGYDGFFFVVGGRNWPATEYLNADGIRGVAGLLSDKLGQKLFREVPLVIVHQGDWAGDYNDVRLQNLIGRYKAPVLSTGSRRRLTRCPPSLIHKFVRHLLFTIDPDLNAIETVESIDEPTLAGYSLVLEEVSPALIQRLAACPRDIYNLHPEAFERLVATLLRDEGFEVETLGRWNEADGGVDILAVKRFSIDMEFRAAVQCKRYSKERKVSAEPIRSLAGVLDRFRAHVGVVATTSFFTNAAREEVRQHFWRISLRDYDRLVADMKSYGIFSKRESGLWLPTSFAMPPNPTAPADQKAPLSGR